jgi:hypothetical protein
MAQLTPPTTAQYFILDSFFNHEAENPINQIKCLLIYVRKIKMTNLYNNILSKTKMEF